MISIVITSYTRQLYVYRGLLVLEEQRLAARLHLVMEAVDALADYPPLLDYVL